MLVVVAFFHCTCADSTCTFFAHYAIADLLSFLMISKYIDTATASNGEIKCLAYFQDSDSENGEKVNRKWKWEDSNFRTRRNGWTNLME